MWDNLGPALRLLRERKGLSQERLARQGAVSKMVTGLFAASPVPALDQA
jgi:transcriptional regulator with XRE-family HTH domain